MSVEWKVPSLEVATQNYPTLGAREKNERRIHEWHNLSPTQFCMDSHLLYQIQDVANHRKSWAWIWACTSNTNGIPSSDKNHQWNALHHYISMAKHFKFSLVTTHVMLLALGIGRNLARPTNCKQSGVVVVFVLC